MIYSISEPEKNGFIHPQRGPEADAIRSAWVTGLVEESLGTWLGMMSDGFFR